MISGEELAFVRLAMRRRLVQANEVREAVERKKWDTPDRSLRSILVEMGVLDNNQVVSLRDALRGGGKGRRPHTTMIGKDARAREAEDEGLDRSTIPSRLGDYKLVKLLGAGAMGAVYLAKHQELEREVALKLLLTEGAPSPRAVQRFKREARLTARLDHPNIVRVYEAKQDKGYHYIAMDLVRGSSVAELITLGEMSSRRAAHIMRRVAEAVGYAHTQDVIHRDIKPANILVDEKTGQARVTDFGLAVLSEGGEDDRLTRTGAAVGTPAYMAPEQVRGQLAEIDGRTDVYALGSTFYEMLTGVPPFEAPTFLELAKQIVEIDPVQPRKRNRDVPLDLETICLKALEKDKTSRYQGAQEMADDLAAYLSDQEIIAQRPSLGVRMTRWARRRPGLVAFALGFTTILLGALGFYLSRPGYLEISSRPKGAVVLIDGEPRGETPGDDGKLRIELSAGEHDLQFQLDGYQDRAMGWKKFEIDHMRTTTLVATLVSTKGNLRVLTPGVRATVKVFAQGQGTPVKTGTTPYFESLEAGTYEVELTAPGYELHRERGVVISSGGAEKTIEPSLVEDPSALLVEADPDRVTLQEEDDPQRHTAPHSFPGKGRKAILATKPGFLPRRLVDTLGPGTKARGRVTLAPMLAWRRPLEGRLEGRPLIEDIDGDGALDTLALERGVDGTRLVLLPGRGHVGAAWRVPVPDAEVLVDTYDLSRDGILDVLVGNGGRLEVRDGRDGRRLAAVPRLNAHAVTLLRTSKGPLLTYATTHGRLERLKLVVGRSAPDVKIPLRGAVTPPLLLRRALESRLVYAWPATLRVASVDGSHDPPVSVPGLTHRSRLLAVHTSRGEDTWVLAVPEQGRAWVVDPYKRASYPVGEPHARFSDAATVEVGGRGWAFLRDSAEGERVRVFALGPRSATEVKGLAVGLPVAIGRGLVWTTTGDVIRYTESGWERVDDRSTSAELWVPQDVVPQAADLDGDGTTEVVMPSQDQRSILALTTSARWLRWRVRQRPKALAPARLRRTGGLDLVVAQGNRVLALGGSDGRRILPELELPGEVLHLTASLPRDPQATGDVLVACEAAKGPPVLLAYTPQAGAWKLRWKQRVPGVSGIEALPFDVDGDGSHDLLVGTPLALRLGGDGGMPWNDTKNRARGPGIPPRFVGTSGSPRCIGISYPRPGQPVLVSYAPKGEFHWERPIPHAAQPPLLISSADHSELVLGLPDRLVGISLAKGEERWSVRLSGVVGGGLGGGTPRRLIVTQRDGWLRGLNAGSGATIWKRRLPPGPNPPSSPLLLPAGVTGAQEDTVAVVAPSGVLLVFAVRDGQFMAERRYPTGPFRPRIDLLPGERGAAPAFLLTTSDDRFVALEIGVLERRPLSKREQVRDIQRRMAQGGEFLEAAVDELRLLAGKYKDDRLVFLVLAQAHLQRGSPKETLSIITNKLLGKNPPIVVRRLQILATYELSKKLERVLGLIEALRTIDAREAARVAVLLTRIASQSHKGHLLKRAIEYDPINSEARRLLGLYQLQRINPQDPGKPPGLAAMNASWWWRKCQRWWLPRKDAKSVLLKARATAGMARLNLVASMTREDHPTARAAAIFATALERSITLELRKRGVTRPLTIVERTLEALIDGIPPSSKNSLLNKVRELQGIPDKNGDARATLVSEIYVMRPDWVVLLAGIQGLAAQDE